MEKEFDIKMEKISDSPDKTSSKYAIIGYFRAKQQAPKMPVIQTPVAQVAAPVYQTPVVVQQAAIPASPSVVKDQPVLDVNTPRNVVYKTFNILSKSTAEQWLLALIAFLLFIHLICRS